MAVTRRGVICISQTVHHRGEIQVHARGAEPFADDPPDAASVFRITGCAQGSGAGGIAGQMADAGDFAAFLVDHDEGRQTGFREDQFPQIGAEGLQLLKTFHIPAEQQNIPDLILLDQLPDFRRDGGAREADADSLTDGDGQTFLCPFNLFFLLVLENFSLTNSEILPPCGR